MKHLPFTIRSIIFVLLVFVLLIATTLSVSNWGEVPPRLVQTTPTPSSTASPSATATPVPSHTPTRLIAPTFTALSTNAPTPRVYFSTPKVYPSWTPTIVITPTPTVKVTIRIVSKKQLPVDAIFKALGTDIGNVLVKDWREDGLVLQAGYRDGHNLYWLVNPDTGEVEQLDNWQRPTISARGQVAIDDMKAAHPYTWKTTISPDGQWLAGANATNMIVKKIGDETPPVELLPGEKREASFGDFFTWSPSSTRLAYVAYTGLYQIRISDPDGTNTKIIQLSYGRAFSIKWSPNEKYISFTGPQEPQQITYIYIASVDSSWVLNANNDQIWVDGPHAWSPDSRKIAYGDSQKQVWIIEITEE